MANAIMMQHEEEVVAAQLQSVKDLYAELFMLMARSVEEDPLTEQTGGLDMTIDSLMGTIERGMREFGESLTHARGAGALKSDQEGAIAEFVDQLQTGLQIMSERVQRRTEELARERDQFRERLLAMRHKRQSVQGYRPYTRDRKMLDSRV